MEVPSYSASECGCLVLWLRLADRLVAVDELVGRFVAVGFRVAAVLCAGAFLGVVGVGAGSEAVSLSCTPATSDPSATSIGRDFDLQGCGLFSPRDRVALRQ